MPTYVIAVAPAKEFEAIDDLTKRGHCVMAPVERVWKRMQGKTNRKRLVAKPLIGGYVFIDGEDLPSAREINTEREARGLPKLLIGYLCSDGRPVPIPEESVEALRAMARNVPPRQRSSHMQQALLRAGELADIAYGPFTGHQARIERIRKGRAWLAINLFATPLVVEMPVGNLSAA